MDEGQHIGDDLDDRGGPERAHVEQPVADGFERRLMEIEEFPVARCQHGDLAARGQMNTTRHRGFEKTHALFSSLGTKAYDVIATKRRVLDPGAAGLHLRQDFGKHRFGHGRRRETGEDMIGSRRDLCRRTGNACTECFQPGRERGIAVIDGNGKTRAQEACRDMPTEITEADIAVFHCPYPTMALVSQKSCRPQSAYSRPLPDCL